VALSFIDGGNWSTRIQPYVIDKLISHKVVSSISRQSVEVIKLIAFVDVNLTNIRIKKKAHYGIFMMLYYEKKV
jgi:hypothetical protein